MFRDLEQIYSGPCPFSHVGSVVSADLRRPSPALLSIEVRVPRQLLASDWSLADLIAQLGSPPSNPCDIMRFLVLCRCGALSLPRLAYACLLGVTTSCRAFVTANPRVPSVAFLAFLACDAFVWVVSLSVAESRLQS